MDPIANMLVQIKNAGMAGLPSTTIPYSNIKFEIASLLKKEGLLSSVEQKGKKIKKSIEVGVLYSKDKAPRISNIKRVSKPSCRVYLGVKEIRPVLQGHGIMVLSTPKGILTEKEARKEHVGGEVLFKIY